MLKTLSTAVLGASMTLAGSNAVFACGGSCGCQPSCVAAVAPSAPANGSAEQPPVPPQTAGRQSYRSYSFDPSQPSYSAPTPMMRRAAPRAYSTPFSADRKIRGLVN